MIAIIDYDAGNLRSVEKAFEFLGYPAVVTRDKDEIAASQAVVLPGVGAFGEGMRRLQRDGLDRCICRYIESGKPFLGVCLGLQLLFERSEEDESVRGLGILPGEIVKIPSDGRRKVPQIGWNSLKLRCPEAPEFSGVADGSFVYFVHSYYLRAGRAEDVSATAEYGVELGAAVRCGNVCAFQFHPEKSGETGLLMLDNLAKSWGIAKDENLSGN